MRHATVMCDMRYDCMSTFDATAMRHATSDERSDKRRAIGRDSGGMHVGIHVPVLQSNGAGCRTLENDRAAARLTARAARVPSTSKSIAQFDD